MINLIFNKYFGIFFILLGLQIPLAMIEEQVEERSDQRDTARQSVRESWTGEQSIFTGLLVIPYEKKVPLQAISGYNSQFKPVDKWEQHIAYVVPKQLSLNANLSNQTLAKSIYQVPVYTAKTDLKVEFELSEYERLQAQQDIRMKQQPYVAIGIKDPRGIVGSPKISYLGKNIPLEPGTNLRFLPGGFSAKLSEEQLLQGSAQNLKFEIEMQLNGMEQLTFISTARDNKIITQSDWPHPIFDGAFLPITREVSGEGYSAEWKTGIFSTNIQSILNNCLSTTCNELYEGQFGVRHMQSVDIYQQSLRSIKYGLLVILATFCIFALYEILSQNIAIHPISYLLTGTALAIFFLLLVALSEHISFEWSYWISSIACSGLIAIYVASQSRSNLGASFLMLILNGLYLILFFIIRSEDHALLSGSLLLFFLLAIVMVVTRKLDWYKVLSFDKKEALDSQ